MKFDAIIFDLDGTLWDSTNSILIAWNNIFRHYKIDVTIDNTLLKIFMGMTNEDIKKTLNSKFNIMIPDYIFDKCIIEELNVIKKQGGNIYDEVIETLRILKKTYNLFIVSNCQKGYIEEFLKFYNIYNLFLDFESAGNTKLNKAENISIVMKRNNIKNAIYIGDTYSDYISAQKNNIPFIHASYGFEHKNIYKYEMDSFSNLIDLLSKIEKNES